jgi:uncharacterized protein (DUF362 family)
MTVFVAREKKNTKEAISRIVDAFADKLDLSKGVFIKPNVVFPVKEKSGQITRHRVVKALVELLRERQPGVDIVIGEGVAAGAKAQENFRVSGYSKLADELHVPLLNLDEVERVKVKWGYGFLKLPKLAFEKTYINLPILKRSSAAGFSGAMKNQKGLVLPNMKKAFHKLGLHRPIAELNSAIQPQLTIMDCANFSSEQLFFAADNTYEADQVAFKFLGISEPQYMKIAGELGVGKDDYELVGETIGPATAKKSIEENSDKSFLRLRFRVSPRTCSMCRYLFQDIGRLSLRDMKYRLPVYPKLIYHALKGAEVILGSDHGLLPRSNNVICIGDCTKKLAKEHGYTHISGCPPGLSDLAKLL